LENNRESFINLNIQDKTMDLFEAIDKRRSIRKYLDVPVEWDKIVNILKAGKSAPSAGNLQNWRFIVVANKQRRRQLAEASLQQYWMETAPVHIVVCSMTKKSSQFYGMRGERLYDIQNCAGAVENMLLAATSQGLGSCWVGAFDENEINDIINIPPSARAQAIVTIGYPDEVPPRPAQYSMFTTTSIETFGWRIASESQALRLYGLANREKIEKIKSMFEEITGKIKHHVNKAISKKDENKEKEALDEEHKDLEEKHGREKLEKTDLQRHKDDLLDRINL
jgi:nitroreductase